MDNQHFKQFCQLLLNDVQAGKIKRQTAAYQIAGRMFDEKLLANKDIEEVVMLAGTLELPYHQATQEGSVEAYEKEWQSLLTKINNLE